MLKTDGCCLTCESLTQTQVLSHMFGLRGDVMLALCFRYPEWDPGMSSGRG